jgi:hypothetical protein
MTNKASFGCYTSTEKGRISPSKRIIWYLLLVVGDRFPRCPNYAARYSSSLSCYFESAGKYSSFPLRNHIAGESCIQSIISLHTSGKGRSVSLLDPQIQVSLIIPQLANLCLTFHTQPTMLQRIWSTPDCHP